ncbi:pyocin activator PrtN family protein [Pseudomonas sp. PDM29]|uniref:pyocin activator PrtN family protein n=1 Tax=Pseudomonas sp. PDM29 TaxID=2854771 RepID=UPI001C481B37|nr:pyocin activator PrtN family protein [Pseudomonas sp. PDM29]MBV7527246.1 pyocin activator PrtN family protein [Pseudomonas sp. PDM29]
MSNAEQTSIRLQPAPEPATVELLYRIFGDVLVPLEKIREKYFRNLNSQLFVTEIYNGRIQLPITTLDTSRKAPKYAHIRHVASLIDIRAYKADEDMQRQQDGQRHVAPTPLTAVTSSQRQSQEHTT